MPDTFARFLSSSDALGYFALQKVDGISSICIIRVRQTTQVHHLHSHGLKNPEEPPRYETLADNDIDVMHNHDMTAS